VRKVKLRRLIDLRAEKLLRSWQAWQLPGVWLLLILALPEAWLLWWLLLRWCRLALQALLVVLLLW